MRQGWLYPDGYVVIYRSHDYKMLPFANPPGVEPFHLSFLFSVLCILGFVVVMFAALIIAALQSERKKRD